MTAGLLSDAWLTKTSPEIGLYRFETQIFREAGEMNEVVEINLARS
jgi:AMMECR1 domain-containing protein